MLTPVVKPVVRVGVGPHAPVLTPAQARAQARCQSIASMSGAK